MRASYYRETDQLLESFVFTDNYVMNLTKYLEAQFMKFDSKFVLIIWDKK